MNYSEKIMFVSKNESEIKSLRQSLKDICNIVYVTKKYLDYYLLVANSEAEYYIGIIYGNLLQAHLQTEVKWVDVNEEWQEINNMCICRLCLNESIKTLPESIIVISDIKEGLQELLYDVPVNISYNDSAKECNLYVNLTDVFPDSSRIFVPVCSNILTKIKCFIDSYTAFESYISKPIFSSIDCIDFFGNVVSTEKQKRQKAVKNMSDYFDMSSLSDGLKHPEGYGLAPKPLGERQCSISYLYGGDIIEITDLTKCENGIEISANASTCYTERYTVEGRTDFNMEDSISIKSKVEIVSDTKLVVKSDVTVKRKVKGKKRRQEDNTVYDALYKNTDYTNTEFSFSVTDYYEIIDVNLLLHYTDCSKFYETFAIPFGFEFKDGLLEVVEVIYDDTISDWICYEDISEVKKALLK